MKNITLQLMILSLLMVSCTTDTIVDIKNVDNKVSNAKSEQLAQIVQDLNPENPANIYDLVGKVHNDILDTYLAGNYQHTTIEQISKQIEVIATQNNDLVLLNPGTNLPINPVVIQEIINNPQSHLNQTIVNSSMTNTAKNSLSGFMNDILIWENQSYEEIYQFIISFESSVISNTEFNTEDKRVILTTSSIVRYSKYYDKERKDKDWDSSIGHGVAGLSGAIYDPCTAIKRSLVTGIMIYNQGFE